MAPDSPLKRSSPEDFDDTDGPSSKRRRTGSGSYSSQTPRAETTSEEREPGDNETAITQFESGDEMGISVKSIASVLGNAPVVTSENEQMDITLKRSIAIALKHVGFESASKEAMDSFLLLAETYASEILSNVLHSTTTCRRTLPIPQDYHYAFEQMQITPSSLTPHKKLPQGLPPIQPQYQPQAPPLLPLIDYSSMILRPELTGAADKASKKYIPKKLPPFPPLHTYKHTDYYTVEHETDPSKIRERGAEDRRAVEAILHKRLDESSKRQGRGRNVSENQSEKVKKTGQLWELAMADANSGDRPVEAKVVIVNASRKYGRKARPMHKKPSRDSHGHPGVNALIRN